MSRRRWWPDLPVLAFLIIVACGLLTPQLQRLALISGEGFMHVRFGQEILSTMTLPTVDTFSSTRDGQPYVSHEWGFQVIAALFHKAFAVDGLVLLAALGWAIAAFFVARSLRKRGVGAVASWLTLALGAGLCAIGYRARPQLASFVLFAILLEGLDDVRVRSWSVVKRSVAAFVFFAVWACLHPGGLLGFAVLALDVVLCGELAELAVIPAAAVGLCATLYGVQAPLTALRMISQVEVLKQATEWNALKLLSPEGYCFMAFVVLAAAGAWLSRPRKGTWRARESRRRLSEAVRMVVLGITALMGQRLTPFFAIAAAPLVGLTVTRGLERLRRLKGGTPHAASPGARAPLKHELPWLAAGTACAALAAILAHGELSDRIYRLGDFQAREGSGQPVAAVDFIRDHLATFGPHMYNNHNFGSYLIYALPERKVFIDGRDELYGEDFLKENLAIVNGAQDAALKLEIWGIDWAIFHAGSSLSYRLGDAHWQIVYSDRVATVYVNTKRRQGD